MESTRISRAPHRQAARWLIIAWHHVGHRVRTSGLWAKLIATLIQFGGLFFAALRFEGKHGAFAIALFFGGWFYKTWKVNGPNVTAIERNHAERSARLYRLIDMLERNTTLTGSEIHTFQVEALVFLASYVRDHRKDTRKPTIFANLLRQEGDDIVVVARDREHRTSLARYPKSGLLAYEAMRTGTHQVTGDVYADFPNLEPGKPYRSVLVIPIFQGGAVVGGVSIDSSHRYAFDIHAQELVDHLAPYVRMLAWTMRPRAPGVRPKLSE